MAHPVPTEHAEQVAFLQWFRLKYRGVMIFAIPNGGARNKATAGRLKAEGVTPGVPDLFIPAWRIFVEMKRTKGGQVSQAQKDMMDYLKGCGYSCIIARGCDDAIIQMEALRG